MEPAALIDDPFPDIPIAVLALGVGPAIPAPQAWPRLNRIDSAIDLANPIKSQRFENYP